MRFTIWLRDSKGTLPPFCHDRKHRKNDTVYRLMPNGILFIACHRSFCHKASLCQCPIVFHGCPDPSREPRDIRLPPGFQYCYCSRTGGLWRFGTSWRSLSTVGDGLGQIGSDVKCTPAHPPPLCDAL